MSLRDSLASGQGQGHTMRDRTAGRCLPGTVADEAAKAAERSGW